MTVRTIRIERFRCLHSVELEPDAEQNVIVGGNGAGKTSILEALFFLGRGRSFRPGNVASLIQAGSHNFTVFAELAGARGARRIGVEAGRAGLKCQVDGDARAGAADLVNAFAVQVIDPQVHELVQGAPHGRRRFLDWGVFHVKHDFLPVWRRYRRALQQRNQALRDGGSRAEVRVWEAELIGAGGEIDRLRRVYLEGFEPDFQRFCCELLGMPGSYGYRPGWSTEQDFAEALEESWERDRRLGQTNVGPHRAELMLEVDETAARNRLSRGQQKLLGIALVLAQSEFVARRTEGQVTLLVDEPAAELDSRCLERLMGLLEETRAQLFISALDREALPGRPAARVFHVEQGNVTNLV